MKGLHKVSRRYGCAACHPLHFSHVFSCRPILRKLAVIFGQQLITFNSNNFTLSSMFSFHMRGPEKEKQCTLREAKQNALEYYCYPLICFPNTILSR